MKVSLQQTKSVPSSTTGIGSAYLGRSAAARSPKPFISVLTISIGAYCLRWKLLSYQLPDIWAEQSHYTPLIPTVASTPTVVWQALHLGHEVDTVGPETTGHIGIVDAWVNT